jgi:TRAP-type mannitol/chloroaromatic compound transport system permease large subunit
MSRSHDTIVAYQERLIAYAVGAVIYFLLPYTYVAPVFITARPAISAWILIGGINHIWAHVGEIWKDPMTHFLGMPYREVQIVLVVLGCAFIGVASWTCSYGFGESGFLLLAFALEVRITERESWRRYRAKQARATENSV